MHTAEQLSAALAGRYVVEHQIGEGGMATVYLARDVKHDRKVALKVLKPELGAVLGVERFLAEIKVTANLQHPNLLPLFDSGEALGLLFYVMPFVEGETLRARLEREQQLPVDEAVRIAAAIASALAYAHERGVIHRDLKPENILMQSGQPVVADFGIALAVSNAGGARVTQTGLSLGTPLYMSPEQATGDRTIDARSDIYSLAAMTYEMIAGEPPHTGPNAQAIMAKLLTADAAPLSSLRKSAPVHVELAVAKGLAKVPADRFASAADFAAALDGSRAVAFPSGTPRGATGRAARPFRGRAREVVAWTVAVAATAAALWLRPDAEQPRPMVRVGLDPVDSIVPQSAALGSQGLSAVAISPDGTMLAYIGSADRRQSLYVRELSGETFRQVAGADRVSAPTFSPDGRSIAFLDGANHLLRIPVAGGVARTLADFAGQPSWADDGNLYYSVQGSIRSVPADGGPERAVVERSGDNPNMVNPNPLPGVRAALVQTRKSVTDEWRIGVVDLASGKLTDLGVAGTRPMYVDPGFIVFSPTPGVLAAVQFDARRLRVSGSPVTLAQFSFASCDCAVARRSGAVVYRWNANDRVAATEVALVDRRGIGRVLLDDGRHFDQTRVSPDGKRVAVRAGGTGMDGDVWLYELAGGAMSRLTSDNNSYRASWTRDGAGVLWISRVANMPRVWMRPWDGSAPASVVIDSTDVAEYQDGAAGGWSALRTWQSRDVAIIARDSVRAGRALPLTSLTNTPANETNIALSPNGALVAYQSDETGELEVYVRPVPGPGKRLTVSVGGGEQARWSPDGKTLYYVSRGTHLAAALLAPGAELAVIRRDSLFALAVNTVEGTGVDGRYDVMPNGREFVIVRLKGVQARNPLRTTLLLDWQSLFAAPAAARAP